MMKTVMAQGVFDVLHPGHLYYLRESRKLGDELVVVIARDNRIDRELYFTEDERRELVAALEMVDRAILGSEGDIYATVEKIDPEVITLGYDQDHSAEKVREMAEGATGHSVDVKRIGSESDYSSSELKEK